MKKSKLAIILSHPVQYYSPLFVEVAKHLELKVFYGFKPNAQQQGKEGFGKAFEWDVDLLSGYDFEFVENLAQNPSSAFYKGCDTPTIGERLKSFGATHVISFGWHLKMYRQALKYCNKNKIPIAVRGDSQLNPQLPLWKKLLKKIYYPYFLRKYDAFLSVGKRNKAYLRHYGVPEERIIFSPHAVDQSFWTKDNFRKEKDVFTFIWVGKFIALKRPLDVIRAFRQMKLSNQKVRLKMAGTGGLLDKCKREVKGEKNIELVGFKNQTKLRRLYSEADCLILSSDSETWGLVVNEAFSVGIPAIVTKVCGCSEDLIDEENGRVYSWGDINELRIMLTDIMNWSIEEKNNALKSINEKNKIYHYNTIIDSFKIYMNTF